MKVEQTRELPFSACFLKKLVCDIDSYSQFIPYLHDSSVVSEVDGVVEGKLTIKFGPFIKSFKTLNHFDEDKKYLYLSLKEGPFKDFSGYWLFDSLGPDRTKVSFFLNFHFKSNYFDRLFEHAVGYIYSRIIDSFAQEAQRRSSMLT